MIVVELDLPRGAREGDRQLAAGIVVAEQHVSDRPSVLISQEPALHYCWRVADQLRNSERSAVHKDHDNRFIPTRRRANHG